MSRAYKALIVMFVIVCLVAVAVHMTIAPAQHDWYGLFFAVLAALGWAQTIVLALRIAPSVLGCSSLLQSTLLSVGLSGIAVSLLYRESLPQSASTVLTVGGCAIFAASLFLGRLRPEREKAKAGAPPRPS